MAETTVEAPVKSPGVGDIAKDPRYLAFAKGLSRGWDAEKSLKAANFTGTVADAKKLARNPAITNLVVAYRDGVHEILRAATPLAVQRQLELMMGDHGATPAVQQRAADSILDRGGVPKVTQQIIDRRGEVQDSLGQLLGGADEVALLIKKGKKRSRAKLKPKNVKVE